MLENEVESLGKIGTRRGDFGNVLGLDKREALRRGMAAAKLRKKFGRAKIDEDDVGRLLDVATRQAQAEFDIEEATKLFEELTQRKNELDQIEEKTKEEEDESKIIDGKINEARKAADELKQKQAQEKESNRIKHADLISKLAEVQTSLDTAMQAPLVDGKEVERLKKEKKQLEQDILMFAPDEGELAAEADEKRMEADLDQESFQVAKKFFESSTPMDASSEPVGSTTVDMDTTAKPS